MNRFALLGASCLALSTALPVVAQTVLTAEIVAPPLVYTQRTLANGLNVYAMPDPTAGTVTVQVWYDVGGKDDPEGRSGFAHLFEHILSRKTVNIPYGQIAEWVANAGGTRNASTGQDFTNYYETVPPEYLETMLWTHAERMARPVVDQAVFDTERSIVKEELRQNVLAPPYGRLSRFVIGDNAYDASIYRRSVIGSIEDLDSARIEDARAFHEAYYRPATATLIVSGNFDQTQLDAWVDQYFADITNPDRPVPVFERPVSPPRNEPRQVVAYAPNVPLPAIAAIFPGVEASHADNAALDVMTAVMSRGESSRLYRSLIYNQQLATSASLGATSNEEDGTITANITVAAGKSIAETEAALTAELARMRDEPITPAELGEAQTELLASDLRQRETASGRAFLLGRALVSEGAADAPDIRLASIRAVTTADVQRVANTYLNERARVSIRYLDESQRPEGLSEDSWRNPVPVPTFLTVPPAILPPNDLLPEDQRQARPAPGPERPKAAPVIAERTLANGLRVIVARSTDLPIMNAELVISGGSSADSAEKPGLASMVAGLATQGAGVRAAPEIASTLEALGARINSRAEADATMVSVSSPVASADAVGDVLKDVVTRPTFAPVELTRYQNQTANRLRVALRQPGALASQVLARVAYGSAPYGAPGTGTPASIQTLTRDEVVDFHARWWRPDNAALIITGAMTAEEGFTFAEQALGKWSKPTAALPVVSDRAGTAPARRMVVVDLPGSGQAAVTVAVRGPNRADDSWYPLTVANAVMGGGSTGRLFQEVRAKRGLSYGANSALSSRAETGLLTASTQTKNESAAEVLGLVLAEFDRLVAEPVEEGAVTDRERFLTGAFARSVETTDGLGGFLADTVQFGLPLSEAETYAAQIEATAPQSLRAAADASIDSDQTYVVVVGDTRLFIDELRAAYPELELISAEDLDLGSADLGATQLSAAETRLKSKAQAPHNATP